MIRHVRIVLIVCAMVDPYAATPLYRQIADVIAGQIERGDLVPHQAIPSEKTLQQTYGVGRSTARAAIAELRARGLVFTVPQRGSYVKPQPVAE